MALRRRTVTAAVALFALALPGVALTPGASAESKTPKHGDVLNPHPGQRLPAGQALIRVRARSEARPFKVQLNGEPIARHFSAPRRGIRRLKASLDHGLKHGRNRLHVRVGKKSEWTRFRIRRDRHLVGAGLKSHVPVGAKALLEGHHVRANPRQQRAGAEASYRWRTVAGPQHQEAGLGKTTDQPSRPHTRRPAFKPTVAGRYRLRLTVTTANGVSSTATTDVQADPPPMVPVDTLVRDPDGTKTSHIQVGESSYPGALHAWAQVVVLDRRTLELVSNKPYFCNFRPAGQRLDRGSPCPDAAKLSSDLAELGADKLVIVSSPITPWYASDTPVGLEEALSRIGVGVTGLATRPPLTPGGITAIGVPGTPPGQGDWHTQVCECNLGAGAMQGYLVRNNEGNYTFESYDRVDFNTQAAGSTASQNVIQVGDQKFTQGFDGGIDDGGGFQVVVLDAQTLAGNSHWFETDHSDRTALRQQIQAMRDLIHGANTSQHRQLVIITSLGSPAIQYYKFTSGTDDSLNTDLAQLVNEVEQLGGTRNGFYRMLDPGLYARNSYTLVSVGNSGPGQGTEAVGDGISGTGTGPLNTTPIAGALARTGPNYGFDLQGSPRIGAQLPPTAHDPSRGTADLMHVVLRKPTPWPEQDPNVFPSAEERARKQAAIKWIGLNTTSLRTSDPRGQYWTKPYPNQQFDYNGWDKTAFEIQGLSYSQARGVSFTEADLEWAKTQLAGPLKSPPLVGGEIGLLESTHRYLDVLATPNSATALQNWAILGSTAAEINGRVGASNDAPVDGNVRAVFDLARALVTGIPGIGEGFNVVNDVYDFAFELAELKGKPVDDDFPTTVGSVGVDFADRMHAAQLTLTQQLPNTIAADYGRLKTVGACASLDQAGCPFPVDDWYLKQSDQNAAVTALKDGTQVWAYGQLLPAKYTLFRLPQWWKTAVDDQFYSSQGAFGRLYPFRGLPASAQFAKPIYRNIPGYSHATYRGDDGWTITGGSDRWQIFALGYLEGGGTGPDPWVMKYPQASVTDRLFGSTKSGGLGVDPETFFDTQFAGPGQIKSFNRYPTPNSKVGWCGFDVPYVGTGCD